VVGSVAVVAERQLCCGEMAVVVVLCCAVVFAAAEYAAAVHAGTAADVEAVAEEIRPEEVWEHLVAGVADSSETGMVVAWVVSVVY
jgi:hypothetical protein